MPKTENELVTASITNIVLEGSKFKVYATFNGNNEDFIFLSEVTAPDIIQWAKDRKQYYESLVLKEIELQKLLGAL